MAYPASENRRTASRKFWRCASALPPIGLTYSVSKNFRRNLVAHALQDFQFFALRQAARRELCPVEVAADPLVGAVKDGPVEFLEVEGEVQRAAHALVLELLPAQIGNEADEHARGAIGVFEFFADDPPFGHRREIVAGVPAQRLVFDPVVEDIGLERFELDTAVGEIGVLDAIEIVLADAHGKVSPPVVLDTFIDDAGARIDGSHPVRAGADRCFERRCSDVPRLPVRTFRLPPVLRQDLQLPDDLRQFAIIGLVEGEGDFALAGDLGARHMLIVELALRIELDRLLETPDDIVRRDRLAVVPAGALAQAET
jgi:hypothetical protein